MPSLDEILKRREERQAAMPAGGGTNLFLRDDDVVICHSLYSGQADDPYMEYYIAHEEAATRQGGFRTLTYCPVQSGHDPNYNCQKCKDDVKTKDRFAIWFYVYRVLHKTLRQGEQLPVDTWLDGKQYFVRDVNGPRYWDASAWKNSPLNDLGMLAKQLGDLRSMRMLLVTTGSGLDKVYKLYPEQGTSPIDSALYEQAKAQVKPVVEMLRDSLAVVPTVQAPEAPSNVTPLPTYAAPLTSPLAAAQAPIVIPPAGAPQLPPFKAPVKPEKLF